MNAYTTDSTERKRGRRKLHRSLTSEVTCQTHKGGLLKLWIVQLWKTFWGKFTSIPAPKRSLKKLLFICHTAHGDLPQLSHLQYLKPNTTAVPILFFTTSLWGHSIMRKRTGWAQRRLFFGACIFWTSDSWHCQFHLTKWLCFKYFFGREKPLCWNHDRFLRSRDSEAPSTQGCGHPSAPGSSWAWPQVGPPWGAGKSCLRQPLTHIIPFMARVLGLLSLWITPQKSE